MIVILNEHIRGFTQTGVDIDSEGGVHYIADDLIFCIAIFDKLHQVMSADY